MEREKDYGLVERQISDQSSRLTQSILDWLEKEVTLRLDDLGRTLNVIEHQVTRFADDYGSPLTSPRGDTNGFPSDERNVSPRLAFETDLPFEAPYVSPFGSVCPRPGNLLVGFVKPHSPQTIFEDSNAFGEVNVGVGDKPDIEQSLPTNGVDTKDPSEKPAEDGEKKVMRVSTISTVAPVSQSCSEVIWSFLQDSESSTMAGVYDKVMPVLIITCVCITLLQSADPPPLSPRTAAYMEMGFDGFFFLELMLRFTVCPKKNVFFCDAYNVIDLLAVSSIPLRAQAELELYRDSEVPAQGNLILVCVVPILRLLKTLRHFQAFVLVLDAFRLSFEALPVLLFIIIVIVLVFSALIFAIEPRSNIPTLPYSMWFTIVSLTTVGYGDVTPITTQGKASVALLIVSGVMYMSIPVGMIGQIFNQVWSDRDRVLLKTRARQRLVQWGYTARDIPLLFQRYDHQKTGELDLKAFRHMISEMKIGLRSDRVVKLFQLFDEDGSGAITDEEFVKTLFPSAWHEIYGSRSQRRRQFFQDIFGFGHHGGRGASNGRIRSTSHMAHSLMRKGFRSMRYPTHLFGSECKSEQRNDYEAKLAAADMIRRSHHSHSGRERQASVVSNKRPSFQTDMPDSSQAEVSL